jgi:hypothetical protein
MTKKIKIVNLGLSQTYAHGPWINISGGFSVMMIKLDI